LRLLHPLPGLGVRSFGTARIEECLGRWPRPGCRVQPHHAGVGTGGLLAPVAPDAPSPMLRMGPLPRHAGEDPRPRLSSTAGQTSHATGGKQSGFLSADTRLPSAPDQTEQGPGAAPHAPFSASLGDPLAAFVIRAGPIVHAAGGDVWGFVREGHALAGLSHTAMRERDDHASAWTKDQAAGKKKEESFTREASPTGGQDRPKIRALDPPPFMGEEDHAKHGGGGSQSARHLDGQNETRRRQVQRECLPAALPAPSPLRCLLGAREARYGARHFRVRHAPA
jgi:hypothetical protein